MELEKDTLEWIDKKKKTNYRDLNTDRSDEQDDGGDSDDSTE